MKSLKTGSIELMVEQEKDFCFCTLALGSKYRRMAKDLSADLQQYSPGTQLVVYTDKLETLRSEPNILAFKHTQQGIGKCYHDKRFVIEKALSMFRVAICIDADTRIIGNVPETIQWLPGITSGAYKSVYEMGGNKIHPTMLKYVDNLVAKLNLSSDQVQWTDENLFIVARDEGKELEFIKQWGKIARYFELRHLHAKSGNTIGLAAAKVGWTFNRDGWKEINQVRQHLNENSQWKGKNREKEDKNFLPPSALEQLKEKLAYNCRLNIGRITAALSDFDFYYR